MSLRDRYVRIYTVAGPKFRRACTAIMARMGAPTDLGQEYVGVR